MGRLLRPQMPGVVFHVTSRLQGRVPLLRDLEDRIVPMITVAATRSDARVVGYTIMPNHLHVLLQQGADPLSRFMQPLLRRIALLLRRSCGCEGHVFERRYRESACLTADYLRNSIAYVHLNAVRGGLAVCANDFTWCSHARFGAGQSDHLKSRSAVEDALRLFAPRCDSNAAECGDNYRKFIEWRLAMDAYKCDESRQCFHPPSPPLLAGGDEHWQVTYAPFVRGEIESRRSLPRRLDLRDLAIVVLRDCEPGMELEDLRSGGYSRPFVRARRVFIRRALALGHTGRSIARFLSVSPATVSSVRAGG